MMKRWAESFPRSTATTASAMLSVAVHAVLIGGAVYATTTPAAREFIAREANIIARFLAPPDRQGGQSGQREEVKFAAIVQPSDKVPGTRPRLELEQKPAPERVSGQFERTVEARPQITGSDSVFTSLEVDSAASRYSWSAAPAYPQSMLEQKREGFVKARWVVDEAGYADTTSLEFVDYTSSEFARAVRDALPFMRFSTARMGAKAVRQLVEQEFAFRISTVIVTPPGPTKKPET